MRQDADMLVKLYDPRVEIDTALEAKLKEEGILIKRALSPNRDDVFRFVKEHFTTGWANEVDSGIIKGGCYLAVKDGRIIGFAAYEGLFPNFFGPTGVSEEMRGKGIGRALLLRCLVSMREKGYRYAIIGWTGPQEFYAKCCGATVIPDSIPASYGDLI